MRARRRKVNERDGEVFLEKWDLGYYCVTEKTKVSVGGWAHALMGACVKADSLRC